MTDGDGFEAIDLQFELGSLTPAEIQRILDEIMDDLGNPGSDTAQLTQELGIEVRSAKVEEPAAFVIEGFALALLIKFAEGAAAAGGTLFFNKVIKPRIDRKAVDGIGERKDDA